MDRRMQAEHPRAIHRQRAAAAILETMPQRFLCLDSEQATRIHAAQPSSATVREVARRLALLGDPTRVRIALALRDAEELCVGDTANLLGLTIALVSHHVRALAAAGLAEKRRDGKLVRYRLTPATAALLEFVLERDAAAADG